MEEFIQVYARIRLEQARVELDAARENIGRPQALGDHKGRAYKICRWRDEIHKTRYFLREGM